MLKLKASKINLNNLVEYFYNGDFKNSFLFSGLFKIEHKQLSDVCKDKKYIL